MTKSVQQVLYIVQRSEIATDLTRNSVGCRGVLGRGFGGVTRRTATGPSEAGLSPAAALAHVPGMGKGRVAYEKSWAWRSVFLALGAGCGGCLHRPQPTLMMLSTCPAICLSSAAYARSHVGAGRVFRLAVCGRSWRLWRRWAQERGAAQPHTLSPGPNPSSSTARRPVLCRGAVPGLDHTLIVSQAPLFHARSMATGPLMWWWEGQRCFDASFRCYIVTLTLLLLFVVCAGPSP